jgi:hypothetical protein
VAGGDPVKVLKDDDQQVEQGGAFHAFPVTPGVPFNFHAGRAQKRTSLNVCSEQHQDVSLAF